MSGLLTTTRGMFSLGNSERLMFTCERKKEACAENHVLEKVSIRTELDIIRLSFELISDLK